MQAQPKLRTIKLWLGPQEIEAELALTPAEIITGMMFRQDIAEKEGMLFVFPDEHRALGDISTWGFNLACLLFAAMALPLYAFAARRPYVDDNVMGRT